MRGRKVVLLLILVMTAVSLGVAGIAMHMLYDVAFAEQRAHLVETAQSQARLIEAIARHEVSHSGGAHPESPQDATLSRIVDAHKRYQGFGQTGEFTLARREGDQIVFLLSHRHYDLGNPKPIPFSSQWGESMRRALSGLSGTVIGLDYRGVEVLAAYEPVAEFDWGIVAKIDLAEVRAPFVRAGIITGCAGLAMVLVGAVLFFRIGTPVVQRLEESEKRFRSMAETTSDWIWEVNQDGVYTYASPKVRDLLGYEPEEVVGKTPFDFMPADEAKRVAQLFKERMEARKPFLATENTNLHRDGHPVVLETSGVPILDRDGKLLSYRGIDRDITDRKQAEEVARTAQQQLLEQQRSEKQRVEAELDKARDQLVAQTRLATIGQISASIAHDLRNPLGTVCNAIYYLKRRLTGGEPQIGEYLDIIDQEITAANGIIANLMSMIRSGEPAKQTVDLGRIVHEVLNRAGLPEGVRCRTSLDPDPFTVRADAGQLRQVITNLVRNAVQALDRRGEILVTAARSLDHDTIVLQDDGPGIPPNLRERVFEPLFTTRTKGTGLGLTICRQIIERHGGIIEVVDHTGRGASFRIRLPR